MISYACRPADNDAPDLKITEYTVRYNCRTRRLVERTGMFFYFDSKKNLGPVSVPMDETVLPGSPGEAMMDYACSQKTS